MNWHHLKWVSKCKSIFSEKILSFWGIYRYRPLYLCALGALKIFLPSSEWRNPEFGNNLRLAATGGLICGQKGNFYTTDFSVVWFHGSNSGGYSQWTPHSGSINRIAVLSSLPLLAPFPLHGYRLHPPLPAYPPPLENALTTVDATLAVQPKGEAIRGLKAKGQQRRWP